jgi:hypothetical protein
MRMLAEAGSPQAAAASLLQRLEALEAAAAQLEASLAAAEETPAPQNPAPEEE